MKMAKWNKYLSILILCSTVAVDASPTSKDIPPERNDGPSCVISWFWPSPILGAIGLHICMRQCSAFGHLICDIVDGTPCGDSSTQRYYDEFQAKICSYFDGDAWRSLLKGISHEEACRTLATLGRSVPDPNLHGFAFDPDGQAPATISDCAAWWSLFGEFGCFEDECPSVPVSDP